MATKGCLARFYIKLWPYVEVLENHSFRFHRGDSNIALVLRLFKFLLAVYPNRDLLANQLGPVGDSWNSRITSL
jgi:hypothetical protein